MAAAAATLIVIFSFNRYIPYEARETVVIGYSALGVLFAALIYYCATRTSKVTTLLSSRFLRWFGKYSYAMYVFHWPITQAYQAALQPRLHVGSVYLAAIISFVLVTAVSSVAAVVSWHLCEVQFLKLKRFFEYRDPCELSQGSCCPA